MTFTYEQAGPWLRAQRLRGVVDIGLISIAAALGAPMEQLLSDIQVMPKKKRSGQRVGEFCGGTCVEECTQDFGAQALHVVCSTCPD